MKTKKQTVKEAEQALSHAEYAIYARKIDLAAAIARELGDPYYFGTFKLKEVLKDRLPEIRFANGILEAACNRCRHDK